MSGIVGSRLNNRGSGLVGSLGTDGQVFTSAGAGKSAVYEASAGFDAASITGATDYGAIVPATDDTLVMYDTSATALREVTVAALGNTPSFYASKSATTNINSTTWTKQTFDGTKWDTHSAWDTTNYKFIVPANCDGTYRFETYNYWYTIDDGERCESRFYINNVVSGSSTHAIVSLTSLSAGMEHEMNHRASFITTLTAADEVEFYGRSTDSTWTTLSVSHLIGYRLAGL